MTQFDKLISRILSLDKNMRFEEIRKVLEAYGYEAMQPRSGSSHWTFRKPGCDPITVPKHQPIKKFYVELVAEIVLAEGEGDGDRH